jgi:RNA polymerase sigma factor (sigma-70 family)
MGSEVGQPLLFRGLRIGSGAGEWLATLAAVSPAESPSGGIVEPVPGYGPGEAVRGGAMDPESRAWVDGLTSRGAVRDDTIARLHGLMLRMARSEAARRSGWHGIRGAELDDVADQAADDAVLSVLRKVTEFRGDSRFTTWACAFAIHEVSRKFGRHVWRRDGVQLDEDGWRQLPARLGGDPAAVSESRELVVALQDAVVHVLTPLQRRVFVGLVVDGVPLDVLAVELGSTRNAIYKTMFDARGKLRGHLVTHGYLDPRESR